MAIHNHHQPVFEALKAFQIMDFFVHPCVEWSNRKDQMIKTILSDLKRDGVLVYLRTTLFIDDDRIGRYREQIAGIGVHFLQKGVDILRLKEVFSHPHFRLVSFQKSLL